MQDPSLKCYKLQHLFMALSLSLYAYLCVCACVCKVCHIFFHFFGARVLCLCFRHICMFVMFASDVGLS